jgi:hypothetical protein
VERWSASATQPDVALALATAAWLYWSPGNEIDRAREAFRLVNGAIHRGDGNLPTRPGALLRIANAVLEGRP